ncbi:hypothetical protein OG897_31415 [Streptomyces sp. NBC_00237]|uniref:hypothetical protein n=1 Tax=Streptomyces sp. NBC_00237 TaxID=2975687 RepID=UPI00224C9C64|nr:hypothetical protein [Streptomyces sp. NBC_00237]MCX5205924.1 hypothetical protein [Streptomyces sp. NBC_00237]
MLLPRRQIFRVSRQSLCTATLLATVSAGGVLGTTTAGAGESVPGTNSPQAQPRGDGMKNLPTAPMGHERGTAPSAASAADGQTGIPATALDAYRRAAAAVGEAQPLCKLPWELLGGIGKVESQHAGGYGLKEDGTTAQPIRGPRLDGKEFALVRDTEQGRWDGDSVFDRAVGPLQFIPSTWKQWGADGDGDGARDPNSIYDAALGAGLYLCAGNRDLSTQAGLDAAVLSYNRSREYVTTVLGWMKTYREGKVSEVPNGPATAPVVARGTTPVRQNPGVPAAVRTPRPVTPPSPSRKPAPAPAPKPTPDTTPAPAPMPDPVPKQHTLVPVGAATITAHAGEEFTVRLRVRTSAARVLFTLLAASGARFPGSATETTVTTAPDGTATAPRLTAGPLPGRFTIRASLPGNGPATVVFAGVVTDRPGATDTLTLLGAPTLTADTDSVLPNPLQLRATLRARPAPGARITATLLAPGNSIAQAGTDSPYFLGKNNAPARSLLLDPTGPDGRLTLPPLHTGTQAGTYTLRLTTQDNTRLDLTLTIQTAPDQP